eukprot:370687_1
MGKKKKRGSDRFTAPVKEAQIGGCYVNEDEDEKHDMQIEAIDELRKQNAHLASSANNHKTELIGVKEELLDATKTIDKLRKETERLKRENAALKQKQKRELRQTDERHKAEIVALNKAIDTLTADIGQKRDEFAQNQEDISKLQTSVSDQNTRNDALNDQVNGLSHELDG